MQTNVVDVTREASVMTTLDMIGRRRPTRSPHHVSSSSCCHAGGGEAEARLSLKLPAATEATATLSRPSDNVVARKRLVT